MNIKNHEASIQPQTIEIDVQSEEYSEKLAAAEVFAKKATVNAEFAEAGIAVETVLADGTVETKNVTKEGDVIITNPGGEQYIVRQEDFFKKYQATENDGEYRAVGMVRAIKNDTGNQIELIAPWGEKMTGDADCYIVSAVDLDKPHDVTADRYIIGAAEFKQTYGPIQEVLADEV